MDGFLCLSTTVNLVFHFMAMSSANGKRTSEHSRDVHQESVVRSMGTCFTVGITTRTICAFNNMVSLLFQSVLSVILSKVCCHVSIDDVLTSFSYLSIHMKSYLCSHSLATLCSVLHLQESFSLCNSSKPLSTCRKPFARR